ncbi:MAG: ATP-grasp domain-containing protein [Candidatus Eiseniibacteriota bacterium]|nr:MAG: ATP-grasp domain-containing protein [Candidatus Eisenbacteria bacterium]
MKVAIVYNRESERVINLFGLPNREKYGLKSIKRISDALKEGGHQVQAFEGDKDLIERLEEFMPRVMKHERPGMVFNLSYGIQGQARYTHVPGMLEMIGLPYVGSGPLAHSLSLDKVVSKMIFVQQGLPTPDFAVLDAPGFEMPKLKFPLIVKPKNEAVSFGIKIVSDEKELREAADVIFQQFRQSVLVERYIAGREINVGLLGNNPVEAMPPAEVRFGEGGPQIYTYEDKTHRSEREIEVVCPAPLDEKLVVKAEDIARRAFKALGCSDCARVDMRLDEEGNFYLLEINSLPSLGEGGSYVKSAAAIGLDFTALVNRLVDVAAARYFGLASPPDVKGKKATNGERVAAWLTERRDDIEQQIQEWSMLRSRTSDPVGIQGAIRKLGAELTEMGLNIDEELTDPRVATTWTTPAGLEGGTLLIGHMDVPLEPDVGVQMYRREPEWLFGEGIGSSRAPLVSARFALRALRRIRQLRRRRLGVLYYCDEGRDCRYSAELIRSAASKAKRVLILRPGNVGDYVVTERRGQRRYRLTAEGQPLRLGRGGERQDVLRWMFNRLEKCAGLSSRKDRLAVATIDLQTRHLPLLLPHEVTVMLLVSYPDEKAADSVEAEIREILTDKRVRWKLEMISSRPPMRERRATLRLAKALEEVATEWEIPLRRESSLWPSVAGLVAPPTGVVCGMGPVAKELYTPDEAVQRISVLQRTLLLAEFIMTHD